MTKIAAPHPCHTQFTEPTRLLRKCHMRKLYRRRRKVGWRPPIQSRRMKDWQIDGLDQIFRGFGPWYRATHDENGYLLPHARMPGLRPMSGLGLLAQEARYLEDEE